MAPASTTPPAFAPSIHGLRLLNGHPLYLDSLFEGNNVVVLVLLAGTPIEMDALCQLVERVRESGVVILAAIRQMPPGWMQSASAVHLSKNVLLGEDSEVASVHDRYRSAFGIPSNQGTHAFVIDKSGRVTWHGELDNCKLEEVVKGICLQQELDLGELQANQIARTETDPELQIRCLH